MRVRKWGEMTSSYGRNILLTGPLLGESTGNRWIPLTKASDAKLYVFFDLRPNKTVVEQIMETPVIWEAIALITTSL